MKKMFHEKLYDKMLKIAFFKRFFHFFTINFYKVFISTHFEAVFSPVMDKI